MFALFKIKTWMLVGVLCAVIITIHIAPVMADDDGKPPAKSSGSNIASNNSNPSCISCPDTLPPCPTCPPGIKCVLSIRTCLTCPVASCDNSTSLSGGPPNNTDTNKSVLPGVIGGVVGAIVIIFAGLGCFMYQRKSRKSRGTKLEETTSMNSENVIPIAYIPSTTPKIPENAYQGLNASLYNTGTARSSDTLIDLAEDEDASCEVGTILQATKTSPVAVATAANTATLVTATRVKPALVRINTIKSNNGSASSTRSVAPDTSNTPVMDRSLLNTPISSVQNSPTSANMIIGNSDTISEVPRIDIERSSGESSRPPIQATSSSRQHLNSPFLDPIEGRQSFGLFGSDEVYGTDPAAPQIQRGSTTSSASTNGRSTMLSDEGDGEIMIFWGGSDVPVMPGVGATSTPNKTCGGGETNSNIENQNENTTETKLET